MRLSNLRPRWPYWPSEKSGLEPLSNHWRPSGYILLSEAVDSVGRAKFEGEWSGQELKARPLPPLPSEIEETLRKASRYGIRRLPPKLPPRARPSKWEVITTQGHRYTDTEEAASALWDEERPKLLEMWKTEHSARLRYESTVCQIRTDLYDGVLPAWAHRRTVGDLVEIPSHIWGREGIEAVFESEGTVNRANLNMISFNAAIGPGATFQAGSILVPVEGRVLLQKSDIETYLKKRLFSSEKLSPGTIGAERQCRQWIRKLASQERMPENKKALWGEAENLFGSRLSRRAFDRA